MFCISIYTYYRTLGCSASHGGSGRPSGMALDNPRIRVTTYEGSGHALESPEGQGTNIIRNDALEAVTHFIRESGMN